MGSGPKAERRRQLPRAIVRVEFFHDGDDMAGVLVGFSDPRQAPRGGPRITCVILAAVDVDEIAGGLRTNGFVTLENAVPPALLVSLDAGCHDSDAAVAVVVRQAVRNPLPNASPVVRPEMSTGRGRQERATRLMARNDEEPLHTPGPTKPGKRDASWKVVDRAQSLPVDSTPGVWGPTPGPESGTTGPN